MQQFSVEQEFDIAKIKAKLERTSVKACDFFKVDDLLMEAFTTALQQANATVTV